AGADEAHSGAPPGAAGQVNTVSGRASAAGRREGTGCVCAELAAGSRPTGPVLAAERLSLPGFCFSVHHKQIAALDYSLAPPRYVGAFEVVETKDVVQKIQHLQQELVQQLQEERRINTLIQDNLAKLQV
ncbi:MAG: hypothetical protein AAF518_09245, partial [Spirochaetota bacterium]